MRSMALTASAASLMAQFRVEHRPSRPLVDVAVGGDGDDQHVAEPAGGLQMADMAEVQEVERAVRLDDGLAGAAALLAHGGDVGQGPDLVARAGGPAGPRPDQLGDA